MKYAIYSCLDQNSLTHFQSNGVRDTKRILLTSKIHAGIRQAVGRDATLVMTTSEAIAVATGLIGLLSADELAADPESLVRIRKFLAMATVAETTGK